MKKPCLILFLLIPLVVIAQKDTSFYKFHIGTDMDNEVGYQVSDLTGARMPSYRYALNVTVKYFLNKSNSLNFCSTVGSDLTSVNIGYIYPKSYPVQLKLIAGCEHAFFARRKFNILTGASLIYTFLPYYFAGSPLNNQSVSSLGGGFNLGVRYNISTRFSLETNWEIFYYHEIDKKYELQNTPGSVYYGPKEETLLNKNFSLELFYHFNLSKKK